MFKLTPTLLAALLTLFISSAASLPSPIVSNQQLDKRQGIVYHVNAATVGEVPYGAPFVYHVNAGPPSAEEESEQASEQQLKKRQGIVYHVNAATVGEVPYGAPFVYHVNAGPPGVGEEQESEQDSEQQLNKRQGIVYHVNAATVGEVPYGAPFVYHVNAGPPGVGEERKQDSETQEQQLNKRNPNNLVYLAGANGATFRSAPSGYRVPVNVPVVYTSPSTAAAAAAAPPHGENLEKREADTIIYHVSRCPGEPAVVSSAREVDMDAVDSEPAGLGKETRHVDAGNGQNVPAGAKVVYHCGV